MADAEKLKYTLAEIAEATGISLKTLSARKRSLVKSGQMAGAGRGRTPEYTLDEVRMIIRPKPKPGTPRGENVATLKKWLRDSGYAYKKEGGS